MFGGLSKGAEARPLAANLPALADAKALATPWAWPSPNCAPRLRPPLSRIGHYQRFRIPKKTGGERLISAPMPRLKRAQYWILDNILAQVPSIGPRTASCRAARSCPTQRRMWAATWW